MNEETTTTTWISAVVSRAPRAGSFAAAELPAKRTRLRVDVGHHTVVHAKLVSGEAVTIEGVRTGNVIKAERVVAAVFGQQPEAERAQGALPVVIGSRSELER
jgi:hypothetical protein